jgi:hypothetical protein
VISLLSQRAPQIAPVLSLMFVAAILPRMTRIPAEAAASKSFRERTADEIEVFTLLIAKWF